MSSSRKSRNHTNYVISAGTNLLLVRCFDGVENKKGVTLAGQKVCHLSYKIHACIS